jgi:hypothetical protein
MTFPGERQRKRGESQVPKSKESSAGLKFAHQRTTSPLLYPDLSGHSEFFDRAGFISISTAILPVKIVAK